MKVIIADDHFLVLDGLELLLSTFDYVEKMARTANYFELKEVLNKETFDVLLLDIHFGKHDGRTIVNEIKSTFTKMKVIALTSHGDTTTIKTAINAGFDGYLLKIDGREQIDKALKAALKNETYFSPKTQQTYFEHNTAKKNVDLTQREKEILELIVKEKTTREIAETLFVSEKTIETHRGNIMLKMDVRNIAGMVRKAVMMGLVQL